MLDGCIFDAVFSFRHNVLFLLEFVVGLTIYLHIILFFLSFCELVTVMKLYLNF